MSSVNAKVTSDMGDKNRQAAYQVSNGTSKMFLSNHQFSFLQNLQRYNVFRIGAIVIVFIATMILWLNYNYESMTNNRGVLDQGLFRGAADWDDYTLVWYTKPNDPLPRQSILGTARHTRNVTSKVADCVAANDCKIITDLKDIPDNNGYLCGFMSGKRTEFLHDYCVKKNSTHTEFHQLLYTMETDQYLLTTGTALMSYIYIVSAFEYTGPFNSWLLEGSYAGKTKVRIGNEKKDVASTYYVNGDQVKLEFCKMETLDDDLCTRLRAYIVDTGNMIEMTTAPYYVEPKTSKRVVIIPLYEEESVFSVVRTRNQFYDNLGLDGIAPKNLHPWANPYVMFKFDLSYGNFRFGLILQLVVLEVLILCIGHVGGQTTVTKRWFVLCNLASFSIVYIQLLVVTWLYEIYYLKNNIYLAHNSGASFELVLSLLVVTIELIYITLDAKTFFLQTVIGNSAINKRPKVLQAIEAVCYAATLAVIIIVYAGNKDSIPERLSIRSQSCPGKAISCGWRHFSAEMILGVILVVVLLAIGFADMATRKRVKKSAAFEQLSGFEQNCLGMDIDVYSEDKISTQVDKDNHRVVSFSSLALQGFTFTRNGHVIRSKDSLFYIWTMYAPGFLKRLINITIVYWPCVDGKMVDSKKEFAIEAGRRTTSTTPECKYVQDADVLG